MTKVWNKPKPDQLAHGRRKRSPYRHTTMTNKNFPGGRVIAKKGGRK